MEKTPAPAIALALGLAACAATPPPGAGRTTMTSAVAPRPDATGGSSRTVDKTGFENNAGLTSDQARPETSGVRATETASDKPTGSVTGTRLPGPADAAASRRAPATTAATTSPMEAGDLVARTARAACDHDMTCNRIAAGGAWASQEQCMARRRERAQAELGGRTCTRGLDATAVGICLAAIRGQACDASVDRIDAIPECRLDDLCAP